MKERIVIDRFEGKFAVCERENLEMINIPKKKLPKNVKENDVLVLDDEKIYVDEVATLKQKEKINEMLKDLWEHDL